MTAPRAADLPVGSKVELGGRTYTRILRGRRWQRGLDVYLTSEVQSMLNAGATVLRVGDGRADT